MKFINKKWSIVWYKPFTSYQKDWETGDSNILNLYSRNLVIKVPSYVTFRLPQFFFKNSWGNALDKVYYFVLFIGYLEIRRFR
jgi:hypothetical protein